MKKVADQVGYQGRREAIFDQNGKALKAGVKVMYINWQGNLVQGWIIGSTRYGKITISRRQDSTWADRFVDPHYAAEKIVVV